MSVPCLFLSLQASQTMSSLSLSAMPQVPSLRCRAASHRYICTKVLLAEGEETPFTEHCRNYENNYQVRTTTSVNQQETLIRRPQWQNYQHYCLICATKLYTVHPEMVLQIARWFYFESFLKEKLSVNRFLQRSKLKKNLLSQYGLFNKVICQVLH